MKSYISKAALFMFVVLPLAVAILSLGENDTAFALTEADCRACHSGTVATHHARTETPTVIKCPSASPYIVCPTTANYSCDSCHLLVWDGKVWNRAVIRDCTYCHSGADHLTVHEGKVLLDAPDCSQCHVANAVTEHKKYNKGCSVCHDSTNTTVVAAMVKAKTTPPILCLDCHGAANHVAAHDKAVTAYADCGKCHATNVVTEHANRELVCAVCHASTNTAVQAAIAKGKGLAGQTVYCADCHSSINGFGNHTKQHDQTSPNVVTSHEQLTTPVHCVACHTSPLTILAIDKGMSGQPVACSDCHPTFNKPPVASAGPSQTAGVNTPVSFSGAGSTDPDGSIAAYAWNFGDGSTGTGVTTSHTYAAAGTYTVTLTVTDNLGATGTAATTVTVQAAPVPASVYADQVLWIQNLSSNTNSDSSVASSYRTDITTRFKDNILTDTFTVYNKSPYKVITMKLSKDANLYTQVSAGIYVKALYNNSSQTIKVYPYKSDGNSLNTYYSSTYTISKTGWTQIDLTSLASRMKGFGWMKFRVTCTSTSFDAAEGNFTVK